MWYQWVVHHVSSGKVVIDVLAQSYFSYYNIVYVVLYGYWDTYMSFDDRSRLIVRVWAFLSTFT